VYGLVFRLYRVVFHEVTKKIIIHDTKNFRIRLSLIYAGKVIREIVEFCRYIEKYWYKITFAI